MKTITKEEYKNVVGYENLYKISNLGNVKSFKCGKERILKQGNCKGYFNVSLSKDHKVRTFTVHKLMAMAFLNHVPCGHKIVVDHVNNDSGDNRVENLQLISQRENTSKDKKSKGHSSKYVGVSFHKPTKKYRALIFINKKLVTLGHFKTELEAHNSYQDALKCVIEDRVEDIVITSANTSSRFKGVSWHKANEKWKAYINIDKKRFHLGYFINEIDAFKAYERATNSINLIQNENKLALQVKINAFVLGY